MFYGRVTFISIISLNIVPSYDNYLVHLQKKIVGAGCFVLRCLLKIFAKIQFHNKIYLSE